MIICAVITALTFSLWPLIKTRNRVCCFSSSLAYIFFFIATLNNSDVRITVSCMRPLGNDFIFCLPSCWSPCFKFAWAADLGRKAWGQLTSQVKTRQGVLPSLAVPGSLEQERWGFTGVICALALLNHCFVKRILPVLLLGEDDIGGENFQLCALVEGGLRGGITFISIAAASSEEQEEFHLVSSAGCRCRRRYGNQRHRGLELLYRYFSYWSSISCFLLNKFSFSTNGGTFYLLWAERLFDLKGKTVFGHLPCCQVAHFLLLAPGMLDRHKWTSEVKGLERWLGLLIFRGSGSPEVLVKIVFPVNVESVERLRTNPQLQFHALMHRPSFSFKAPELENMNACFRAALFQVALNSHGPLWDTCTCLQVSRHVNVALN